MPGAKDKDESDGSKSEVEPIADLPKNLDLIRVKSLKNHLKDNVAVKDIEDLQHDIDNQIDENKCVINFFEEINWHDPFPSKKCSTVGVPAKVGDRKKSSQPHRNADRKRRASLINKTDISMLVYDECKFTEAHPPGMIFLPSKIILRKMMKVCAQVESFSDLYFVF